MSLKKFPELHAFFSTYFPEADADTDLRTVETFVASSNAEKQEAVLSQAKSFVEGDEISVEELGTETNRWFSDSEEAKDWIRAITALLAQASGAAGEVTVKDVNGAILTEGDSVQVIKDLKVKGGASDLKRGTLIKKIHLIGDSEAIECRVDGSTLVLKTCFLKKS